MYLQDVCRVVACFDWLLVGISSVRGVWDTCTVWKGMKSIGTSVDAWLRGNDDGETSVYAEYTVNTWTIWTLNVQW